MPIRIALLTDGLFPYKVGGMQKHSYYLAKYMASLGIQVDLYYTLWPDTATTTPERELFTEEEYKRIRLKRIPIKKGLYYPGHYIVRSYQISCQMFNQLGDMKDIDFIFAQGFTGWKLTREKSRGQKIPQSEFTFMAWKCIKKVGHSDLP